MKITRIIALAIIAGATGAAGIQAQTLRETRPPAEYPPLSYTGKQYVDSRGCIYIRAGIGGDVNWVPRVSRSRKQICGYAPTNVQGTTRQRQRAATPELITLEPSQQPQQATAGTPPRTVTTTKPRRAPAAAVEQPTTAASKPVVKKVVRAAPAPAAAPQPAAAVRQPAGNSACAGLSDISRQYTNSSDVRCGPQGEAPVSFGGQAVGPQSSLLLTPNTRVVQKHIYQDRRLSNSFTVPEGYRPVWTDGRLNPQRAERTARSAVVTGFVEAPAGYETVERADGRMNPMRGVRTPEGDVQMARIWTRGLPRRLVELPLDRQTVTLPRKARVSAAEARHSVLHLSTRSAPGAEASAAQTASRRYVRAATYADPAQAKAAARKLAAAGLSVRLGTVSRKGQPYKVVLAGPYRDTTQAAAALADIRQAGFSGARISK
ncbi:sporulation protein [Rhodobacteraceae bacterium (ex Bugula neritina AB1)]|nr:sporulation protein [Rhodobacteraceae bacterium (ex Bugula neritina AB1)]